ncbi:MAG: hypothetical protein U9Q74_04165 [Gemmatimonadota bacterium]|nr:hypothetical protein [Gemmatimonadota bacterium]
MTMLHLVATVALINVALLLGATWYEAVVMAPNYERDVPDSITAARRFLARTTPAHYFRILAPLGQLFALAATVLGWGGPGRGGFVTALVTLVVADVITFTFHYPRLAVMFKTAEPVAPERLGRAAREWAMGNWVRGILLVVAQLALLHGLLVTGVAG